jgi:predicted dinucleotide-binding enzyme
MSASLQDFTGTLVLVGAGKMGGAMLEGWLALGLDPARVAILEPNPVPEIVALQDRGVRINPVAASITDAAVIILAVKPQVAAEVVPPLKALARPGTVAVSVMAGKTLGFLEGALGDIAIVRSIPNTPAAIGRGITVAVPNAKVTAAQRTLAHTLLSGVGAVEWVDDEALIDTATAVSGARRRCRRPAGRSCGAARARHRGGLGRTVAPLAAGSRDAAPERHLAEWNHGGGAGDPDGGGRPRSAAGKGGCGGHQTFA